MNDRSNATIGKKIFWIVSSVTILLLALVYTVTFVIVSKSFHRIEQRESIENLERTESALNNIIDQTSVKLSDWAFWDDTYQFVADGNEDYIESNLGIPSIVNLQVTAMVFVGTDGKVVFKRSVDLENSVEVPSEEIGTFIEAHPELTNHPNVDSVIVGVVQLPDGPRIFTSRPILTSDREGPTTGTLIFIKKINEEMIQTLSKLVLLPISIYSYGSASLPEDVREAERMLRDGNEESVTINISQEIIAAYKTIKDVFGNPVLILRADTERDVYAQARATLYLSSVSMAVSIIIFASLIVFLINRYVTSRLSNLSREVVAVGTNHDLHRRVTEGHADEIGTLASSINKMLSALSESEKIEREASRQVEVTGQELRDRLAELEKMNRLMVDRELKMSELKKENDRLRGSRS